LIWYNNQNNEEGKMIMAVDIQWYPGHMAKATRLIREDLKSVDLILLLCDARAVQSSRNEDFEKIIAQKKKIFVFNKSDLADEKVTKEWLTYFKEKQETVFFIDCLNKQGIGPLVSYLKNYKQTFRTNREVRVMIAGIPNVGKSMLINTLARRNGMKTGNRPGVTMNKQWIKVTGDFYLLDTPGVLPPKFDNQQQGSIAALIGSVKDTVFNKEDMALYLLEFLQVYYPQLIKERYKIAALGQTPLEIYEQIADSRGFKTKGGLFDYERTAVMLLDEFKNGKIGRVSFDRSEELD